MNSKAYNTISRLSEQTAIMLCLAGLLSAAGALFLHYRISSQGLLSLAAICLIAFLVSFLAWIHSRLERLAAEEKEGNERVRAGKDEFFPEDKVVFGDRARALSQFERYVVPLSVLLLAVSEGIIAFFLHSRLSSCASSPLESPNFHPGMLLASGVCAFLLMILGKYAAGLAYSGGRTKLRAPSAFTVFASLFALLLIGAFVAAFMAIRSESWKFRNPDPFLLFCGIAVFAAFCLDHVLGVFLHIYRPSEKRVDLPPLYESRVAGLFVQPEGVWEALNQMLEYQFGVRVSPEKSASFISKVLLPLLIFQIACLLLLSCIAVVPAQKMGFVERLGCPVGGQREPGIHFKLPWPLEKIYLVDSEKVSTMDVGSLRRDSAGKQPEKEAERLWTSLPEDAPLYMTVNPGRGDSEGQEDAKLAIVNLVGAQVEVQYCVRNSSDYLYKNAEADRIFRQLVSHSITLRLASCGGVELIGGDTLALADAIKGDLKVACSRLGLGVDVLNVAFVMLQPPAKGRTVEAFQMTMTAEQNRRTEICDAEAYRNKVIPEAGTRAKILLTDAESYSISRTSSARAESEMFSSRYGLMQKYGEIYTTTSYLDRLVETLRKPSKIVVASESRDEVISLDLKDVVSPELLDMASPENMEK